MTATLVAAVPFAADEPVKMLELGSGDGRLAEALLTVFPRATLTALDGSESMRRDASQRLALFGDRARRRRVRRGGARLVGSDVRRRSDRVVAVPASSQRRQEAVSLQSGRRAAIAAWRAARRRSDRPAASRVAPAGRRSVGRAGEAAGRRARRARAVSSGSSTRAGTTSVFRTEAISPPRCFIISSGFRHAGFAAVDCCWLHAGHAVFGGFKQAGASARATSGGQLILTGT